MITACEPAQPKPDYDPIPPERVEWSEPFERECWYDRDAKILQAISLEDEEIS